jgi:hypothetical protein
MIIEKPSLMELWRNQKDNENLKIKTEGNNDFVYGRFTTSYGVFRKIDDFNHDDPGSTCSEITIKANEIESAETLNISREKADYIRNYIVR